MPSCMNTACLAMTRMMEIMILSTEKLCVAVEKSACMSDILRLIINDL